MNASFMQNHIGHVFDINTNVGFGTIWVKDITSNILPKVWVVSTIK